MSLVNNTVNSSMSKKLGRYRKKFKISSFIAMVIGNYFRRISIKFEITNNSRYVSMFCITIIFCIHMYIFLLSYYIKIPALLMTYELITYDTIKYFYIFAKSIVYLKRVDGNSINNSLRCDIIEERFFY